MASKKKAVVRGPERINPALEGLARPIETLKLDEKNARVHDERSIAAISASLERFGQQRPVVVVGKTVVAGNGTLMAAVRLGWKRLAAVDFEGDPNKAKAYALADNRTAELSGWDYAALTSAAGELAALDEALGGVLDADALLKATPAVASFLDTYVVQGGPANALKHGVPDEVKQAFEGLVHFKVVLSQTQSGLVWAKVNEVRGATGVSVAEALLALTMKYVEETAA